LLLTINDGQETPLDFDQALIGISDEEIVELASAFRLFGTFAVDLDSGHLYLSPEACLIHGYAPQTGAIDRGVHFGCFHPEDVDPVLDAARSAMNRRCGWYFNYRVLTANGEYKWVRMVAEFRDKGKAGEFVGVVYEFLANITMAELYLPDEAMTAEGPTG